MSMLNVSAPPAMNKTISALYGFPVRFLGGRGGIAVLPVAGSLVTANALDAANRFCAMRTARLASVFALAALYSVDRTGGTGSDPLPAHGRPALTPTDAVNVLSMGLAFGLALRRHQRSASVYCQAVQVETLLHLAERGSPLIHYRS